jgi:hypothetical protein
MRKRMMMCGLLLAAAVLPVFAAAVKDDAAAALKSALNQGATRAIALLGKPDGFAANADVHIPLPPKLQKARKTLDKVGLKKQTAALELALNRAAEAAVPQARQLFMDSIAKMSPADALAIVKGAPDAATQYFRKSMTEPLTQAFQPIVSKSTAEIGVARAYDAVVDKAGSLGLVDADRNSLDSYVTRRALDGLFLMMAREEAAIRKDPLGQADALLRRVFGGAK